MAPDTPSSAQRERQDAQRERQEWLAEFEAAAARPLRTRVRYAFIKTHRPVLDDAPFRAFDSLAHYRAWCEASLPSWLGFACAPTPPAVTTRSARP